MDGTYPPAKGESHTHRSNAGSSGLAKGARLLGVALGAGLLAGVTLNLLTFLVARYGPSGSDGAPWSLRGNGALVVPFGLGPALLAGAWTALVLHYRSAARWLTWGVGAGLVGAAFVLAGVAALILFGSAGPSVSMSMSLITLAWMCLAPVVAGALRVGGRPAERTPAALVAHSMAGVMFPVALVAGLFAAGVVLPPGS